MSYRVPPGLAHVVVDATVSEAATVFLMALPDGPPLVLRDTAALIWIVAAEGNSDVPAVVADLVERPVSEIAGEVEAYLSDLVARGLLTDAGHGSTGGREAPETSG